MNYYEAIDTIFLAGIGYRVISSKNAYKFDKHTASLISFVLAMISTEITMIMAAIHVTFGSIV